MNDGKRFFLCCQRSKFLARKGVRGLMTARWWKESYGSYEQAHGGRIYRKGIRVHRPAGEDSGDGKKKGFGSISGERSFRNWIAMESSTGARPLSTGASLLQKKGRGRRKNQKEQRNEVDGGSR